MLIKTKYIIDRSMDCDKKLEQVIELKREALAKVMSWVHEGIESGEGYDLISSSDILDTFDPILSKLHKEKRALDAIIKNHELIEEIIQEGIEL